MRTINNDYDSMAHLWWSDDTGETASIRYFVNPVRFNYFRNHLEIMFPSGYRNKKALDVGCGGGLLSEELSKAGLRVTGVDPSEGSIRAARDHANSNGLDIDYRISYGENLPFADGTFDMVFCCDVLEHVDNVGKVVSEISRVLKRGGLFFFDTVNRTLMSRIAVIYFIQECRLTAFCNADSHVWDMFIKPEELRSVLSGNGISCNDLKGIAPQNNNLSNLIGLYKASRKLITYKELAQRMKFSESNDLNCSYMGYGIRNLTGD